MNACDATSAARTSVAVRPPASRPSPSWPNEGAVMSWLATAPTLARRWTQRAATAGEDDEITMPNMPDSGQRALSENVKPSPLVGDHGCYVDLDQPFRTRQRRDDAAGRHREDAVQMLPDGAVDRLAIAGSGDVDRDLADVAEFSTGLAQLCSNVLHRLLCLPNGIADRDIFRGIELLPDLSAHEHHAAAGDHGLAQIIVELLLRIGIPGGE